MSEGTVLVRNSSDPKQIKASRKFERERLARMEIAMQNVLSNENGRELIWELMSDCGTFGMSYVKDSDETAFNEGMRSIGTQLLYLVNKSDPNAYAKMVVESERRLEQVKPKNKEQEDAGRSETETE